MTTPAIYPTLVGLSYSVVKRPQFSVGVATAGSGREVRVGFWVHPMWEWELNYEYLPDDQANGTTSNDLRTLMGFFLSTDGNLQGFLFEDPDDFSVTANAIAVGDGVSQNFLITRTYGLTYTGSEPIGYLNSSATFKVYIDGVDQPTGWTTDTSRPYYQTLDFASAPTDGQVISVDMSYYYYVRFKDDTYDFEKFMDKLWILKKITLKSLRG